MINSNAGEEYINAFPKFKKWINECVCCHSKGYNPLIPEDISEGLGLYYIKKYFCPLSVNEDSVCEVCSRIVRRKND